MPTSEVISAIYNLLPGFLGAWLFYALTAHPKPTPFERTVQALIFTALIQAIVIPIGWVALWIGRCPHLLLGEWSSESSFVTAVVVALVLGLAFSVVTNKNWLFDLLYKMGWTKRTAYPSEWYAAFCTNSRWVYLHLADERRLYGWPEHWPDSPKEGHFVICSPEWILPDNNRIPLLATERMVVSVENVRMVEFEKNLDSWSESDQRALKMVVERAVSEQQNDDRARGGEGVGET